MKGVKDQLMSLFKTKNYSEPKHVKIVYGRWKKPNQLKMLKQSAGDNVIKNLRNHFKLKKENEPIKERIIRDIKTPFEQQEDDYYKPIIAVNFWNNNYIEYKSKHDRNKKPSIKEYLNELKPYLRDITINLPKYHRRKIQVTIAINFISSEDVDEDHVMHSNSDITDFMPYDKSSEVVHDFFESPFSR